MTDEQRLQVQLTHMLTLCQPPYTLNWRPYCLAKADALAMGEPAVFQELPALLRQGLTESQQKSAVQTASLAQSVPK